MLIEKVIKVKNIQKFIISLLMFIQIEIKLIIHLYIKVLC